ncbi:DNA-processing protein DprA [Peribacillus frigoritolerans]|uniref:DNA-processing protein DprA n=1 Tax=Peribacillus frigoritolerans TaxID=450367 RepID=UPI002783CD96|nr:DNA processing protein [Bacillus sp. B2I3]
MLKYLLMLKHLGIDGVLINFIAKNFTSQEFDELFNGAALELHFKYNIFSEKTLGILTDIDNIKKVEESIDILLLRSKEQKVKIVSYFDTEYPESLREIYKKPMFIHVKGNLELLNKENSIACVGTRKPTEEAKISVSDTVKELVERNVVIVSGLAVGIDTLSHKTCLDNKGQTVAVLAHGLDTIYPKENKDLAEKILESGGTLLSEYPLFTKIKKGNFVSRNRIISGLSKSVIIFEADQDSGSMHTARFAYKDNRKIFCPIFKNKEELSTGVQNLLLSNSAIGFRSPKELINTIFPITQTETLKDEIKIQLDKDLIIRFKELASEKQTSVESFIEQTLADYISK